MDQQDKKTLLSVVLLLMILVSSLLIIDWLLTVKILIPDSESVFYSLRGVLLPVHEKIFPVRIIYVVILVCFSLLIPSGKKRKTKDKTVKAFYIIMSVLLTVLLFFGYSQFNFYQLYIYPIIFITHIIYVSLAVASFKTNALDEQELFNGVNKKKSKFMFTLPTDQGIMTIHKPQQNIWIDGGPGSGKSASIIKPLIAQCGEMDLAGFIYDYEGDPTKEGNPILTKIAYTSIYNAKIKNKDIKTRFAFLNFTDTSRTVRVNLFSPKYLGKEPEMYLTDLAATLLKNLSKKFQKNEDFWYDTALTLSKSIFLRLITDPVAKQMGCDTLAHAIAIFLRDSNVILQYISSDEKVAMMASSVITPWKNKSTQQLDGTVSTLQVAFGKIFLRNIIWAISKDEFNLDITNKENPTLLCVGNSQDLDEAISPILACIISCITKQMNSAGKQRSVFIVDELPTVVINKLEKFISTARKHHVATILSVQAYSQLVGDYTKEPAETIKSNCGSQFYGMTGSEQSAKTVSDMFGEIKKRNISISSSDFNPGENITESLQKEKVLQTRDITGQAEGEFVGKIANGDPPFFKVKFDYTDFDALALDVPRFALETTGIKDEYAAIRVLDSFVEDNRNKIISDVNKLLAPYEEMYYSNNKKTSSNKNNTNAI